MAGLYQKYNKFEKNKRFSVSKNNNFSFRRKDKKIGDHSSVNRYRQKKRYYLVPQPQPSGKLHTFLKSKIYYKEPSTSFSDFDYNFGSKANSNISPDVLLKRNRDILVRAKRRLSAFKPFSDIPKKRIFKSIYDGVSVDQVLYLEDIYTKHFFLSFEFEDIKRKIINIIMRNGNKSLASYLYNNTIYILKNNVKKRYKFVIQRALLNVCPFFYYRLESRSGRVFKFPKYISETFRVFLGIKYMLFGIKTGVSNFYTNFANIIYQTSINEGQAIKFKKTLYKTLVDFRSLHRFKYQRGFPYFRFRRVLSPIKRKKGLRVNMYKDYFTVQDVKRKLEFNKSKKITFFDSVLSKFVSVKRVILSYFFHSFQNFDNFTISSFRFNLSSMWGIFSFLRHVVFFEEYDFQIINPLSLLKYMFYIISVNVSLSFIHLFKILSQVLHVFQIQFQRLYKYFETQVVYKENLKSNPGFNNTEFGMLLSGNFVVYKYNQVKSLLLGEHYFHFINLVLQGYNFYKSRFNNLVLTNIKYNYQLFNFRIFYFRKFRFLLRSLKKLLGLNFYRVYVQPFFLFLFSRSVLLRYIISRISRYNLKLLFSVNLFNSLLRRKKFTSKYVDFIYPMFKNIFHVFSQFMLTKGVNISRFYVVYCLLFLNFSYIYFNKHKKI